MKRLEFQVDGQILKGSLHEPEGVRKQAVPLVVLSHGLNSSRTEWYELPDRLAARGYAVCAFDYRGHGESEGERGVQSLDRAKQDLEAAIEASCQQFRIDGDRVALVGHSLGASIAISLAQKLPVNCVVALAPPRRLAEEISLPELAGYRFLDFVNRPVRLVYGRGLRVPYKVDYVRLYLDPKALARARRDDFLQKTIPIKNYKTLVQEIDAGDAAATLRKPTLVMVADHDLLVQRANSRKVYERLAGPKRFIEISQSGHSMMGDARGDAVARHIADFLDEHLRSRGA